MNQQAVPSGDGGDNLIVARHHGGPVLSRSGHCDASVSTIFHERPVLTGQATTAGTCHTAKAGTVHTAKAGTVHTTKAGTIHTTKAGTVHTTKAGIVHTTKAGTVHTTKAGTIHTTKAGTFHTPKAGTVHTTKAGTVHTTKAGTIHTGTVHTAKAGTVHTTKAGTVHTTKAGTVHTTKAGTVHTTKAGTVHTTKAGTVHAGTVHTTKAGTVHTTKAGTIHTTSIDESQGTTHNDPSKTALNGILIGKQWANIISLPKSTSAFPIANASTDDDKSKRLTSHGKTVPESTASSSKHTESLEKMDDCKIKCGLCEFKTLNINQLMTHMAQHRQRQPFKCVRCNKKFSLLDELRRHEPCGDAQFVYLVNDRANPKAKPLIDLAEPYMGDLSSHTDFKNQNGIKNPDIIVNSTNVGQQSPVDLKMFDFHGTPMSLRKRKPKVTNADEEDIKEPAKKTPKKTPRISPKKTSVKVHEKEDQFLYCEYCAFQTVYAGNLKAHIRRHLRAAREHYNCDACSAHFLTQFQLTGHHCTKKRSYNPIPDVLVNESVIVTPSQTPQHSRLQSSTIRSPTLPKISSPKTTPKAAAKRGMKHELISPTTVDRGQFVYACRLCDFTSPIKRNVYKHVYRHRCEYCHKYFPTISKRWTHQQQWCKKPAVSYHGNDEAETQNMHGQYIIYRQNSPMTLVEYQCVKCHVHQRDKSECKAHCCYYNYSDAKGSIIMTKGKSLTKSSKRIQVSVKSSVKKSSIHKKRTSKIPVETGCHTSKRGKTEGFDEKLQMYSCKYCIFTVPSANSIISHRRTHKPTEPMLPNTPAVRYQRVKFARQKEKERTKPRMDGWDPEAMLYACNQCSFTSGSGPSLWHHKKYHLANPHNVEDQDEEPVDIPVDDDDDNEVENIKDNEENEPKVAGDGQKPSGKSYQCDICDFTTHRQWDLDAHKGLHTGQRPQKCNTCNIGFTNEYYLKVHHQAVHSCEEDAGSEDEPEVCPQPGCNFSSNYPPALLRHYRMHFTEQAASQHPLKPDTDNDSDIGTPLNLTSPLAPAQTDQRGEEEVNYTRIVKQLNFDAQSGAWSGVMSSAESASGQVDMGSQNGDPPEDGQVMTFEHEDEAGSQEADMPYRYIQQEGNDINNNINNNNNNNSDYSEPMPPLLSPHQSVNTSSAEMGQGRFRQHPWNLHVPLVSNVQDSISSPANTQDIVIVPENTGNIHPHAVGPMDDISPHPSSHHQEVLRPTPCKPVPPPAHTGAVYSLPSCASSTSVSLSQTQSPYSNTDTAVSTTPYNSLPNMHHCTFCDIYFKDFKLFLQHIRMHVPESPWTCGVCWRNFGNVTLFNGHH